LSYIFHHIFVIQFCLKINRGLDVDVLLFYFMNLPWWWSVTALVELLTLDFLTLVYGCCNSRHINGIGKKIREKMNQELWFYSMWPI